jgi:3-methylcrotonyl-CoA carboxylase alpha subunit
VRFEIEVAGQPRAVEVGRSQEGAADGWQVTIDGRVWDASMVPAGDRWSLLLQTRGEAAPAASRSYDVMFEAREPGRWLVHLDGRALEARMRTEARHQRRASEGASEGHVVAPMPGRVVKVLVTVGSAVEARQGVIVVEAMKMENELRAPRAGIVREIRAAEGASVLAQAVLVVIE